MTPAESWIAKAKEPSTLRDIVAHVANGGLLIDLCETWNVPFADVAAFLNSTEEHKAQFKAACDMGDRVERERLRRELSGISTMDISGIFDDDGELLPISQWPDAVRRALVGIDVEEIFSGTGRDREQTGVLRRVKMIDKTKAIQLLGKELGMFTDKHEVTGKVSLEDIVAKSKGTPAST